MTELSAPAGPEAKSPERDEGRGASLRRHAIAVSFLLCVALPAILGVAYLCLLETSSYTAGAGFSVRRFELSGGIDVLGAVTGLAGAGSTSSDSYLLAQYLQSRTLLEQLQRDFPFRQRFSDARIDLLSRLAPDLDVERTVDYWNRHLDVAYDGTSGVFTFQVRAYAPSDALEIATLLLTYSDRLVNDLSRQARADALALAETEVRQAEQRLRESLRALRAFRETERMIDPAGDARLRLELIGGLEKTLAETQARAAALGRSLASDAPAMADLRRRADALKQQIAAERERIDTADAPAGTAPLGGLLESYESLQVENEFAQKAYVSALAALEKSRIDASRQQRFLAIYQRPALPEAPARPRRLRDSLLLFGGLLLIWSIATLIVRAVAEHVA